MFYTKPWADVLIVLLIVVLFFGPKRLPTLGRSLGQGFREFKDGITGAHPSGEDEERPALNAAQPTQVPTTAQAPPAGAEAQAPASSPPAAQPPTPAPPAAVAAQPSSPPESESAEVASSEHRS
jgi:sec-independent protein translocase protein TatA